MADVKVAIGMPCGEIARWSIFFDSLMGVERPPNTVHIQGRGAVISENRNGIAERALAMDCTHIWYVDDDQVFAPDTLMKLLARERDVVSGLYLMREPPFHPQMYGPLGDQGLKPRLLQNFDHGELPAEVVGAGCLLVKTAVFRKLERPWWRLGQIPQRPDAWGDDTDWCLRVRALGYEIYCDLEVVVGHNLWMTAWPQRQQDGSWITTLVGANGKPLAYFPAARRKSSLVSA